MKHVERRRQNCEELLPEVLALIVSCGGPIRRGDLRAIEIAQVQQETHLRWHRPTSHHVEHQIPDSSPRTSDHPDEQRPHQAVPQRPSATFFHVFTSSNTRRSIVRFQIGSALGDVSKTLRTGLRRFLKGSTSPSGANRG